MDVSNVLSSPVATAEEVLHVIITENVTMLDDGRSLVKLSTLVPDSPLAKTYRKALGISTTADGESPILGKKTENAGIVGNDTEIGVLNKGNFYRGIEQEQSFFLGKISEIFDSKVISADGTGDFEVSVNAIVSHQIVDYVVVGSDAILEIGIGPMNQEAINAFAGFVFSKITFTQMMLNSLEGRQIYDCSWITRINLPPRSTLLNRDKLDGLNWEIDFGGGTSMVASVSLDETSTVILNERMIITENDVTTTPEHLLKDFSTYRTFNLRCQLPRSASILYELSTIYAVWDYAWDYQLWSDSIQLPFSAGPLSATLTVTTSLTVSGYVGWDFDWGGLSWFEAWMSVTPSISVEFQAEATASYSRTFTHTLFEWKTTYSFWVGPVPVWADMQFTSSASLTVSAYAKISFYAQAGVQATFKAGVRWTRSSGWSGISEVTASSSKIGPNISVEAGASVRPAIQFRLAFLFYGVAGPFVECEIYVNAAITYVLPNGSWEVSVNFRIIAGATFAGWLKTILGLDDWSTVIYERQLARWTGTWGPSSIVISETLNPSTTFPYDPVRVYGTATFPSGFPVPLTDVIITIISTGRRYTTTTDMSGYYSKYIASPPSAGAYAIWIDITCGATSGSNSKTLTVLPHSGGSQYTFYRSTTCKGVQASSPYDPISETNVFRSSDSNEWTWVHLTYIYRSLNVKWEWYKPDGNFYTSTTYVIPDPTAQGYAYWEWYKCWGGIYINGYETQDIEGRWTSKVYIDEGSGYQLKAIEDFFIRYDVIRRTMAKDVQTTSPYEPITPTNLFLNTDPIALGWIELQNVAEQLEVKWEWYDPSGALYGTFLYTIPDPSSQGQPYWSGYMFWGWMNISGFQPQSKLGQWTMKAYMKDVYGTWDLEYSEYFTISDNTPPSASGTPVDDGIYSTSGNATWIWSAAYEEGVIVQYQIQIGTAPGGNDVYDGYVGTSLNKTLDGLASGLTYYARVRAMNQVGQWGPWSGTSDGITVDRPPMTLIVAAPEENIDYADVCFNWTGSDDLTPISSLIYSYYLVGYDSGWSPFTSSTSREYYGLPDSNYTFMVRAKDSLGSIDPSAAEVPFTIRRFTFLESLESTGATANLGTITINGVTYSLPGNISKAVGTYQANCNPSLGYVFNHWETVGGVYVENSVANPTTVMISRNGTLRAIYDLFVDLSVFTIGSGSVGRNNTGPYYYGDTVQLTAVPAAGWSFNSWSGDLTGSTNPANIVIDGNKSATATFVQNIYTLTVSAVGAGSVSRNNSGPYHYGDVVQLTAIPSVGWSFSYWSGGLSGSGNPGTLTITGDVSVTATFTQNVYTLTVSTVGGGIVTLNNTGPYYYGDIVQLTASGSTGWSFDHWNGDASGTTNPTAVNMTGNKAVTATFTQNTYTLTITVFGSGSVNLNNTGPYHYGDVVQLTANPTIGWSFNYWGGDLNGSVNPTKILINGNKAVTATFTQNIYALTTSIIGSGSVSRNNSGPYHYGDTVELTALPSAGWSFDKWSGDRTGSTNPTTILIDGNKAVTATFTQNTYVLTVNVVGSGSVNLNNSGPYYYSDVVELTAVPTLAWSFDYWSGDLTGFLNPDSIVMIGDRAVTAYFTPLTVGDHDIAVTNVTTSKDGCKPMLTVSDNSFVKINVTVLNAGNFTEDVTIAAYANTTVADTQTFLGISPGTQVILELTWNTTGWAHGNYMISAYATPVPSEVNIADNTYIDEVIKIVIPGDINGDETIDIYDAIRLAGAYNSVPISPNWNPNADINGDNIVDIYDAIILAKNYGQHYP